MINVSSILEFGDIGIDEEWNDSKTKEMSMFFAVVAQWLWRQGYMIWIFGVVILTLLQH